MWQQQLYRDAAERLGVTPGVVWTVNVDPNGRWMEFHREDRPERVLRYAVRPCFECHGGGVYWYAEQPTALRAS